ncbi:hypothetical protein BV20DRAFT_700662 [Pilatotrama ljubarskyi]|nr:hypothetical protein BV20DRAFT_700662 [Pilatotrama ljubarskyi]
MAPEYSALLFFSSLIYSRHSWRYSQDTISSQRRSVHHVNHGTCEPRGGPPKPASARAKACRLPCRFHTPYRPASPRLARHAHPRRT